MCDAFDGYIILVKCKNFNSIFILYCCLNKQLSCLHIVLFFYNVFLYSCSNNLQFKYNQNVNLLAKLKILNKTSLIFQGYYDTMDAGYKDENGYIFVTARDDDVINVAGHRISTSSLEDAVLRHSDVVDCAVFGVPEPTKGQVPLCLYVPKENVIKTQAKICSEIIKIIRETVGPIASFRLVAPVKALPRTRSGKTLRKSMAEMASNQLINIPSTVEDESVFEDIKMALQSLGYARPEGQNMA